METTYEYNSDHLPTQEVTKSYDQGVYLGEVVILKTWDSIGNLIKEENQTLGSKVETTYSSAYNIPTRIDTTISPTMKIREDYELTTDQTSIIKYTKNLVYQNGDPIADTPIVTTEYVRGSGDNRIEQIKEKIVRVKEEENEENVLTNTEEEVNVLTNIQYTDQILTHMPTKVEKGGVTTSVSYDSVGNIESYATIGEGNSLGYTFTYDKLNRPKTMKLSNGTPVLSKGNLDPERKNKGTSKTGQGFNTFNDAKKALGSAGEGKQWHHIVEQSQIKKSGFDPTQIHNTNNLIAIYKATHVKISGYYNTSTFQFTNGLKVRDWLAGQSFQAQYDFGIKVLKDFGVIK